MVESWDTKISRDSAAMFFFYEVSEDTDGFFIIEFGIYGRCFLAVGDILWAYFFIIE